jgi:hypothetical protein
MLILLGAALFRMLLLMLLLSRVSIVILESCHYSNIFNNYEKNPGYVKRMIIK